MFTCKTRIFTVDYYDDPQFSYPAFWMTRRYEHEAELIALTKLFGEKRFVEIADIGGGYGRLTDFLSRYAKHITLIEPSAQQRNLVVPEEDSGILCLRSGNAEQTGLPSMGCDLVLMVRVMHYIPKPKQAIGEMWRILKPGGYLALEFANSKNFKSRLRSRFTGRHIPKTFLVVGTKEEVPFVNHNPAYIMHLLKSEGFEICTILSVSNFRSPFLKHFLPISLLLILENALQAMLARTYFGPSIFVLAKRPEKQDINFVSQNRLIQSI